MSAAPAFEPVKNRGWITLSIMLATIMQVLDTTIANVALPHMRGSLNAAQDTITWVLTSYIVAAAIMTPVTGWLSDRMGRKNFFLSSVVVFTVASLFCGIATSLPEMVVYRVIQGLAGAALVPLSQAVLLDINPKERHGQAMAMWGVGVMVGPIAGPVLGGWLTEVFNWRYVFFVNLPIGIVAVTGMYLFMPSDGIKRRRFDIFGFAMLSLAVGALQMMLDRGEQLDWFDSPEVWLELGLVIAGAWMFVIHSMTTERPFIDIALVRDRNFVMGLFFIFVMGIMMFSSLALLPPMLQGLFGYPVITTGIVMAPRGIGTMIAMMIVGRLIQKVDPRAMVMLGLLLTVWSLHMMTTFSPQMTDWPIILSGVVQGLGMGLVFVPLSTLAFATLAPHHRTDAASLFSLVRNVGSSIGISIVATVLSQMTRVSHADLASRLTPFNPNVETWMPGLLTGDPQSLAMADQLVSQQAAMVAYIDDFRLMMFISLLALPIVFLLRRPQRQAAPDPAAHAAME